MRVAQINTIDLIELEPPNLLFFDRIMECSGKDRITAERWSSITNSPKFINDYQTLKMKLVKEKMGISQIQCNTKNMGNEGSSDSSGNNNDNSSNSSSNESKNEAAYNNGYGMGYTDAREGSSGTDPFEYIASAHTEDGRQGYKDGRER
jgi:hypothetical protein